MSFYNKILFPVDLSEDTSKIALHVKEVADKFDAEIHIIYVAHVTQYYNGLYLEATYVGDFETEVVKAAEQRLKNFVNEDFKDRSINAKVLIGYPGGEILRYVKTEGTDLIIMGHSSKGIKRALMGSVAGHVAKSSPVPVMVINPQNHHK